MDMRDNLLIGARSTGIKSERMSEIYNKGYFVPDNLGSGSS